MTYHLARGIIDMLILTLPGGRGQEEVKALYHYRLVGRSEWTVQDGCHLCAKARSPPTGFCIFPRQCMSDHSV